MHLKEIGKNIVRWFVSTRTFNIVEGTHRRLLVDFDAPGSVAAGVHPLLIFLVRMNVERERGKQA